MKLKRDEAEMETGKEETKSCFGHNLHGIMDEDYGMIRRIEITSLLIVHDGQVDTQNR
jgi:hypothetical protein